MRPDRPAAVCRELTKIHEAIRRGSLADLRRRCRRGRHPGPRRDARSSWGTGAAEADEVAGPAAGAGSGPFESGEDRLEAARADVDRLVAEGAARGEAARRVAATTGLPRRRLYGARPDR